MSADKIKRQRVTLLKPHTHAGRQYAVGDEIDVTDRDGTFLRDRKIIADVSAPAAATASAKTK